MNAAKYNWKPDHEVHKAARASLAAFEGYFARVLGNTAAPMPPPPAPSGRGSKAPKSSDKQKEKRSRPKSDASEGPPSAKKNKVVPDEGER